MRSFITHMATSKDYPYFKDKLLEYVKSGDCTPIDYSYMVDTYHINKRRKLIMVWDAPYKNQLIL